MTLKHIIVVFLLCPTLVWAQSDSDVVEAAKLGMIEKLYEGGGDHFRKHLTGRGLSDEEVENALFEAIDAYASCLVLAAQEQAHEQGLSEEIILKGIGNRTRGKEESLVLLSLDMDALKLKRAPCREAFGEKLGITVL
jgi:hypothetical protein